MYDVNSRISAKITMPLCNSAFTYSSSKPGKRATAVVFSWTMLIGSAVGLRTESAVAPVWLIRLQVWSERRKAPLGLTAAAPAREAAFAPAAHPAAWPRRASFGHHSFRAPIKPARSAPNCRPAHGFVSANQPGGSVRHAQNPRRFDASEPVEPPVVCAPLAPDAGPTGALTIPSPVRVRRGGCAERNPTPL